MSSNPFISGNTPSQEDISAFPAELTNGLSETETKYTLGGSEDNPEQIAEQKVQVNAEHDINRQAADIQDAITREDNDNPFLNSDSESNLDKGIQSLESIITDLEESMRATALNPRNTEFVVDVVLDEQSKELLDNDIKDVIQSRPEQYESLESIVLCNERSVPKILGILKQKQQDLMQP